MLVAKDWELEHGFLELGLLRIWATDPCGSACGQVREPDRYGERLRVAELEGWKDWKRSSKSDREE